MPTSAFLECVTSIARLYELRSSASRTLSDAGIDDMAIETVALVLSETCTNAFTHGGAETVEVEIAIAEPEGGGGSTITVWVRHEDHDAAGLTATTTMPPPDATFGRGLALVERLVDGMTLSIDPPHIERTCWLRTNGTANR